MAKKNTEEENNPTLKKLLELLKAKGVRITHPITVYTSNKEQDAWVCCGFTGPGVHVSKSEIDFDDFRQVNSEIMMHCPTWIFTDK